MYISIAVCITKGIKMQKSRRNPETSIIHGQRRATFYPRESPVSKYVAREDITPVDHNSLEDTELDRGEILRGKYARWDFIRETVFPMQIAMRSNRPVAVIRGTPYARVRLATYEHTGARLVSRVCGRDILGPVLATWHYFSFAIYYREFITGDLFQRKTRRKLSQESRLLFTIRSIPF